MEILQFFLYIILFNHKILQIQGREKIPPMADYIRMPQDGRLQKGEAMLYRKLLHSYDKELRPVVDARDAVHVNVSITLANIIDIDEKHQSLTTLLWMQTIWYDPFLSWNEAEFSGISCFVIQADRIWTPEVMFDNVLGTTTPVAKEILGKSESLSIFSSGRVTHWTPLLVNLFCPMQMELFPFDIQSCPVVLSPWSHDNTQLRLNPAENVALVGNHLKWDVSKKWIIQDFTAKKAVLDEVHSDRFYDQMHFSITLRRKSTFYVLNLLLPCYLISIIAYLCYVIPPQGGDRINLLLATFLSIVVFVLVVLEIVPEESDTLPLFSKFLLEVMLMNMFQIFYCTAVCGLNSMDKIRLGPPKCLVTWAKCMISCTESSYCNRSKLVTSKQENIDSANPPEKPENETDIEFKILNENSNADTHGDNQTIIPERNIKEWRIIFKVVDILLFMLTFLGLTGYFFGILVAYY